VGLRASMDTVTEKNSPSLPGIEPHCPAYSLITTLTDIPAPLLIG